MARKEKRSALMCIEVESDCVTASIISDDAIPELLAFESEELPVENLTLLAITEALTRVATHVRDGAAQLPETPAISSSIVILSDAYVAVRAVAVEQPISGKITTAHIAALSASASKSEAPQTIFECEPMNILVNGYSSANPVGKQATELREYFFTGSADNSFLSSLTQAAVVANIPAPQFVSRARARASLIGNGERVILEIGTKESALYCVRHESVQASRSRASLQTIAQIGKTALPSEATTFLKMIQDGNCTSTTCIAFRDALGSGEGVVVRALGELFSSALDAGRLPPHVHLLCQESAEFWIEEIIKRIDFAQFTRTLTPPTVENSGSALSSTLKSAITVTLRTQCSAIYAHKLARQEVSLISHLV